MHQGTSFPVGKVNFMDLMPLSFFEFLDALGQDHLLNLLKNNEFDMISVFNNKYKDYLDWVLSAIRWILSYKRNPRYFC